MKFHISVGDDRICKCGSKDAFARSLSKSIYYLYSGPMALTFTLFIKNNKISEVSLKVIFFQNPEQGFYLRLSMGLSRSARGAFPALLYM